MTPKNKLKSGPKPNQPVLIGVYPLTYYQNNKYLLSFSFPNGRKPNKHYSTKNSAVRAATRLKEQILKYGIEVKVIEY